jgi:dihydroorotate dehydrogenase (NAD+) catalytic subunit
MVHDVFRAGLGLPIIGMGGIMTGEDAAEFMIAGADAVMVGTATMANPSAMLDIIEGLEIFAETNAPVKITDITGTLITED